ncbi:carboxyl transferase domain-containing protein [Citricoccus parietis]|uniref:Carboxyl transferase domain-containing protein n=1 Tax=Citricoccus parietis TaxID=592307 RepID=A0ABV5G8J1_9MICC
MEGAPVGMVANDGSHLGGAIDSDSSDKLVCFLGLCDSYGIPVVSLCDTPGFLVGPESEEAAVARRIEEIFRIGPNLSVPLCTVVVRKTWGLADRRWQGAASV